MFYLDKEDNFKLSNKLSILYFYAPWMIYHKKFTTMISSYEELEKEVNFIAINTDHHKKIVTRYQISSIPALIAIYNGKEVARCNGIMLTAAFKNFCNKYKEGSNVRLRKNRNTNPS